jgi:hypothetical protein
MNVLNVGLTQTPLLQSLPKRFLFIDDGPLIEQLTFTDQPSATFLDLKTDRFNPVSNMNEMKADAFIDIIDATFPQGRSTLTNRYSNHIIFKALLDSPQRLSTLVDPPASNTDIYQKDAFEKIERLLMYEVLETFLDRPTNLSFTVRRQGKRDTPKTIIAKLDRAALGDRVCFVLANFLIANYSGTVVIPDFGFYQCPFHRQLIRDRRLIAGVNSLVEVPKFKQDLLLFDQKSASHCTLEDAELLADYMGLYPDPTRVDNPRNDFIHRAIRG